MEAYAFVSGLQRRGICLSIDGGSLVVRPSSQLTDEDRRTLRVYKVEILGALARGPTDTRLDIIRPKVAEIEQEALAKGWPRALLWNERFWDMPRGLRAVLEPDDEITGVTTEFIEILRCRRNVLRFRRTSA